MGQGKSNQMAMQLIRDILKERRERIQQHQIQEFLEFIEKICPRFSECRTLDVGAWKEVGIKIYQCYCNYGPESIPEDTPYFWILIQERLDLNPDQHQIVPSTPPEELLHAFTEQSSDNKSETNNLDYKREFSSPSLATSNAER